MANEMQDRIDSVLSSYEKLVAADCEGQTMEVLIAADELQRTAASIKVMAEQTMFA